MSLRLASHSFALITKLRVCAFLTCTCFDTHLRNGGIISCHHSSSLHLHHLHPKQRRTAISNRTQISEESLVEAEEVTAVEAVTMHGVVAVEEEVARGEDHTTTVVNLRERAQIASLDNGSNLLHRSR